MEILNGVSLDYAGGKLIIAAEVAALINPVIDSYIAKVESGEVDLIKGTDLDKMLVLQILQALKLEVNK